MSAYEKDKLKITSFGSVQPKSIIDDPQSRMLPRQISTGSTRGTQNVGYGSVSIDGSNNRISVGVGSTNVTIGDISEDNNAAGFGFTDASGTLRLLAGQFADGSIGIALSQEGIDVTTATADEYIWSSEFNMFKIVGTNTTTITHVNETEKVTTVYHGLGFAPVTFCFMEINTGLPGVGLTRFPLPYVQIDIATGVTSRIVDFYVSSANLYIRERAPTGFNVYNSTNTIRYYYMKETAS